MERAVDAVGYLKPAGQWRKVNIAGTNGYCAANQLMHRRDDVWLLAAHATVYSFAHLVNDFLKCLNVEISEWHPIGVARSHDPTANGRKRETQNQKKHNRAGNPAPIARRKGFADGRKPRGIT